MSRKTAIAAAAVILGAAWLLMRRQAEAVTEEGGGAWSMVDDLESFGSYAVMKVSSAVGVEIWRAPAQYRPAIQAAEAANGIPAGMLEALLYTESRYRPEIISGQVKSRVGALGIAQFMPATAAELGVDPLNPAQAIAGAGRYLARLYRSTGDWGMALAAYNWGLGNVQRKGIAAAPRETRNYYGQILAAVGGAGSVLA